MSSAAAGAPPAAAGGSGGGEGSDAPAPAPPLSLSPFVGGGGRAEPLDKIPYRDLEQTIEALEEQLKQAQADLVKEMASTLRLTATASFLEEQNAVLLAENAALGESLSIFIRVGGASVTAQSSGGGRGGGGGGAGGSKGRAPTVEAEGPLAEAVKVLNDTSSSSSAAAAAAAVDDGHNKKKAKQDPNDDWLDPSNQSDLRGRVSALLRSITGRAPTLDTAAGHDECRDALMLHTIESLTALAHLSTTLAPPRPAAAAEAEEDIRREELDISLKTAFGAAVGILSDVLTSPTSKETAELLEPFPNQWLLSRFPQSRVVAAGAAGVGGGGNPPGLVISSGQQQQQKSGPASASAWLPLHWLMTTAEPDPVDVEVLMDELAETAFDQDVSPLSIAVSKGTPSVVAVGIMIEKNRESLSSKDAADGALPLMHACACNEDCEVVRLLHEAYPGAVSEQDNQGFRAINYAAFSGYPAVVRFLLSVHPRCASLASKNGSLALHDAAENALRGGLAMVDELFQANTTAIMQTDEDGATPLHRAARSGTLEVVQYLHRLFPKAITMEDREGLLPMHYASRGQPLEVVQYFVQET